MVRPYDDFIVSADVGQGLCMVIGGPEGTVFLWPTETSFDDPKFQVAEGKRPSHWLCFRGRKILTRGLTTW